MVKDGCAETGMMFSLLGASWSWWCDISFPAIFILLSCVIVLCFCPGNDSYEKLCLLCRILTWSKVWSSAPHAFIFPPNYDTSPTTRLHGRSHGGKATHHTLEQWKSLTTHSQGRSYTVESHLSYTGRGGVKSWAPCCHTYPGKDSRVGVLLDSRSLFSYHAFVGGVGDFYIHRDSFQLGVCFVSIVLNQWEMTLRYRGEKFVAHAAMYACITLLLFSTPCVTCVETMIAITTAGMVTDTSIRVSRLDSLSGAVLLNCRTLALYLRLNLSCYYGLAWVFESSMGHYTGFKLLWIGYLKLVWDIYWIQVTMAWVFETSMGHYTGFKLPWLGYLKLVWDIILDSSYHGLGIWN